MRRSSSWHAAIALVATTSALHVAVSMGGEVRAAIPGGTIDPDSGPPGTTITLTTACDLSPERQIVYLQLRGPNDVTEDPKDPRPIKVPLAAAPDAASWTFVIPDIPPGEYWIHLECVPGQLFPMESGEDLARRLFVTAGQSPTATPGTEGSPDVAVSWPLVATALVGGLLGFAVAVLLTRSRRSS